jgi:hypothetical protein
MASVARPPQTVRKIFQLTENHTQLSHTIYNTVFRRNYIFVGTVFLGAFAFEMYPSLPPQSARAAVR